MIKGIYETHIEVSDLERSIHFYVEILGLQLAHYDDTRPIAFLWAGEGKSNMLGLWQVEGDTPVSKRHFAFTSDLDFIRNEACAFLEKNGLSPRNFLNQRNTDPMVFAWMPALSIYFNDPDDNSLEFISLLEGQARPELGVISYDEWERLTLS